MNAKELAGMIDHTILKPEATEAEIIKLCKEAIEFGFISVCVNPVNVSKCKKLLENSGVKVCTVTGFPLGASKTEVKLYETEQALIDGAEEIDMVINVGKLKEGADDYVEEEIRTIVSACRKYKAICKVIIETALLTNEEKTRACKAALNAKADFVKTSTGFSKAGATAEDVQLMRMIVGNSAGVKAAGGIKTLEDALKMIESGANRIGASSGVSILNQLSAKESV